MQLHGVRALLTGAAGGIGSAVAERMARKGAILALVGRQDTTLDPVVERIRAAGGVAHGFAADLSDRSAREQLIDTARARIGGIDMLVNCAGAMSFGPLEDEDPVLIDRVVHMNLVVPMLLARQVLPEMLERGDGRIVNIGSTFGSIGFAWFAAYSASKFGLLGLTQAINAEERGRGVRACALMPGDIDTPLLDRRPAPPPPEARSRMLRAEDVAACVRFVADLPARAVVEELLVRPA